MSLPTLPFAGNLAHDYVFIRSQDRVSGTSEFPCPPEQYEGVTAVELIEANIPNSLYDITTNNNQVGYNVGAGPQTGGITPDAYNTTTLASAYPFGGGPNPLQLTFNTTTGCGQRFPAPAARHSACFSAPTASDQWHPCLDSRTLI